MKLVLLDTASHHADTVFAHAQSVALTPLTSVLDRDYPTEASIAAHAADGPCLFLWARTGAWGLRNLARYALAEHGSLFVCAHGSNSNMYLSSPPRLFEAVVVGGETLADDVLGDERSYGPGLEFDCITLNGLTEESWAVGVAAGHLADAYCALGSWSKARVALRRLASEWPTKHPDHGYGLVRQGVGIVGAALAAGELTGLPPLEVLDAVYAPNVDDGRVTVTFAPRSKPAELRGADGAVLAVGASRVDVDREHLGESLSLVVPGAEPFDLDGAAIASAAPDAWGAPQAVRFVRWPDGRYRITWTAAGEAGPAYVRSGEVTFRAENGSAYWLPEGAREFALSLPYAGRTSAETRVVVGVLAPDPPSFTPIRDEQTGEVLLTNAVEYQRRAPGGEWAAVEAGGDPYAGAAEYRARTVGQGPIGDAEGRWTPAVPVPAVLSFQSIPWWT